jgi:hypothetical protein
MATPPSPKPVRLTITVSPEVHAAFSRMSEVSGIPIGRCMGEWLGDTLEGVEFITGQLAKARQAPRMVVAEMRQLALGAVDQADELLSELRKVRVPAEPAEGAQRQRGGAAGAAGTPRPVIRGGKSTTRQQKGHK